MTTKVTDSGFGGTKLTGRVYLVRYTGTKTPWWRSQFTETARQRNLEKRRAKRLRKQKRKQQRRERKRKQREKLRKRRKQKIRRRQKQNKAKEEAVDRYISQDVKINVPLSAVNDGKHHLKVRSVEQEQSFMSIPKKSSPKKSSQGQCRTKLIDNCSWPHCNRSCPKLKNPKTGKYHHI